MPLDPQTKTMLEQLESIGAPPIWEIPVADARAAMASMMTMTGPGEEVASVEDRTIDAGGQQIPVRLYRPEGLADPAPMLVFYHGGEFVLGDLGTHDRDCRALANRGACVVMAVHYRLAPEHPFPAAVDDATAALAWAVAHAEELGVDRAAVGVGGDSAGGNLAAVAALWARDNGIALKFQLLIYPGVDLEGDYPSRVDNGDGYMLDRKGMEWFAQQYVGTGPAPDDWRLAPMRAASHAGLAPAYIITAEFDPLRDEGEAYAAKLSEAGVPTRAVRYDGMIHGFFSMTPFIAAARPAVDAAGQALYEALRA